MIVADSKGYINGEEKYSILEAYDNGKKFISLNGLNIKIIGKVNTYLGFILRVEVVK